MKQEITLYTYAEKWKGSREWEIKTASYTRESTEHYVVVLIAENTIEVDIPEINEKQLNSEQVKILGEQIKITQATCELKITEIKNRIAHINALEHIA